MEASVVSGRTEEEKGQDRSKNRVYEFIEELESHDFFIGVEIVRVGAKRLSKQDLLESVSVWLSPLGWDQVVNARESREDTTEYEYED